VCGRDSVTCLTWVLEIVVVVVGGDREGGGVV